MTGRIGIALFVACALTACRRPTSPSDGGVAVADAAVDARADDAIAEDAGTRDAGHTVAPPKRTVLRPADVKGCIELPEEERDAPDLELVGRLGTVVGQHPNGTRMEAWVLTVDTPFCVRWTNAPADVEPLRLTQVQIFTPRRVPDMRLYHRHKVRFVGRPSAAVTAWHQRPLLLEVETADYVGTPPTWPTPKPLPDGTHYGHVDGVDAKANAIVFDVATLLRGPAAWARAKRERSLAALLAPEDVAAFTYEVDDDPARRTLPLGEPVELTLLEPDPASADHAQRRRSVGVDAFTGPDAEDTVLQRAFEITLKNGRVVRIAEVAQ